MSRPALLIRWMTVIALLLAPTVAHAGTPLDGGCDDGAKAWAKGASTRIGREIDPVACPGGLVRLHVAGAGCDYEVKRGAGFVKTKDGAFGVSPIVDLDWSAAPESMKKGLADVLAALSQDPSLSIAAGQAAGRRGGAPRLFGARPIVVLSVSAVALLSLSAFGVWWRRRKGRPAAAPAPKPDA